MKKVFSILVLILLILNLIGNTLFVVDFIYNKVSHQLPPVPLEYIEVE